jgi:hypothetical protein
MSAPLLMMLGSWGSESLCQVRKHGEPFRLTVFLTSLTGMLPLYYLLRKEVISAKPFIYRHFRRLCYLITSFSE